MKLSDIKPYKRNAKLHPQEQIDQIKRSIEEFGMDDPIAVWGENSEIIEGHGRYIACKQLGMEEVPVIRLDHLTDEQRRAYTHIHNQLTLNSGFDMELLKEELEDLEEEFDFKDFGFDLGNLAEMATEGEVTEDDFEPELSEEPTARPGQIWKLGDHRLMCGDSTKAEDVAKLMAGELADLVVTDPPYNVNVSNSLGMTIKNDNMKKEEFHNFLLEAFKNINTALKPGGAFYIWYGDAESINFRNALAEAELPIRQTLIWNKNNAMLGWADYHYKHEPCLYGWKEGQAHYFIERKDLTTVISDEEELVFDKMKKEELIKLLKEIYSDRTPVTVINEQKPMKNDLHPTMKPLKLIGRLVRNSSRPAEKVLDLFGGSGSTLMVCEQLGRQCYMMEYDPKYADVIIQRWETMTGKEAELIDEGTDSEDTE